MAAVQAEHEPALFLLMNDQNGHHQEWLIENEPRTVHCVAAHDYATVSSCYQLIISLTYACGGTLDLLMTDVPQVIKRAAFDM